MYLCIHDQFYIYKVAKTMKAVINNICYPPLRQCAIVKDAKTFIKVALHVYIYIYIYIYTHIYI